MRAFNALRMRKTTGGAPGGTYTALDPADTNSSITLSNYNLTATKNGTSGAAWAVAVHGKDTGKWVFEATVTNSVTDFTIGVMGVGGEPGEYLGSNVRSIGLNPSVGAISDRTTQHSIGVGLPTGTVVHVYVDLGASRVWFAKNGTVLNGSPTAGTGGTLMSNMPKAWYPVIFLNTAAGAVTCNFGDSAFAYTTESGFNAWTTTSVPVDLTAFRAARLAPCTTGQYTHAWAEFELLTSSGGSSIFTGGTPGSSPAAQSNAPAQMFDGSTTTFYAVSAYNTGNFIQPSVWIGYDFGSSGTRNVTHIAQRSRDGGGGGENQCPTSVNLYLSADNAVFWKVKTRIAFTAWPATTPGQRQVVAI